MCSWQARYGVGDTVRITFSFLPDIRERMQMEYFDTDFYFTQFVIGHGAFADYLKRFKRVDCDKCRDSSPTVCCIRSFCVTLFDSQEKWLTQNSGLTVYTLHAS